MSLLENLLAPGTIERLGWMLVHILWQATVVTILLALFLRLLRKSSANVRYSIACAALAMMVAMPIVTMRLMKTPGPAAEAGPPSVIVTQAPDASAAGGEQAGDMEYWNNGMMGERSANAPAFHYSMNPRFHPSPVPLRERIVSTLEPALPYVVLGWLVGVFGLSAWHLGGWAQLQRLRRRMVREIGRPLQQRLEELSIRLGVRRAVGLLESALIEVPTVVGWLRPVILLPASTLTGLRPEQLEAILAHELAHVRRYDYLINIVQTVVEILGFYHPAVWWVSRRIRIERENCCDDLAVHVCGSSLQYAKALACMEEIRHSAGDLAMAATGGSLMARIARLLGRPAVDDRRFAWLPGLVALLLVVGVILPAALVLGTPQPPQAVEPAAIATSHDVAEPIGAPSNAESVSSDAPAAQVLLDFKIVMVQDEARVDRETLVQIADALGIVLPPGELNRSGQTLDLTVGEVFRKYILPQPLSAQANETLIRLLQSQGSARALAAPRVLVRDGEGAKVEIFNTIVLPWSDPSGESEKIKCGTAMNVTPHVLDANWVNLEMMTEVSDPSGFGSNQPTVFRTSAETSVTAQNDRYLVWAAVMPTAAPAGPEADRRSVYIMVKPRINLPPQGLALAPDERRPDGTPPRQVLLDVRTVTMDSGAVDSLGGPWSRPTGGPSTSVRTGSAMDETFTDALLTALDRLQADHQATVSSQQIIVQERYQSQIRTLRDQWSAGTQPHKTETGTVLKVKPRVSSDNTIRLDLTIDTTRQLPTPPGSDLPMQSAQTCQFTVTIKDGGTAAIGGLSMPGAQGRPGQETVIFVTTHLLQDRNTASVGAPQAAGPDARVAPPVSPTPEQTASMRREYVNSDPMVSELSKSIVAMERDLITQQALVKEHPRLAQEQAALVDLKDKLVSRRRELEQEFDNQLTKRLGEQTGNRAEGRQQTTVTATFTNADLVGVLAEIARQTGVPIVAAPNVSGTVTATFEDLSLDEALGLVLAGKPYVFKKTPHYYLVTDRSAASNANVPQTVTRPRQVQLEARAVAIEPSDLQNLRLEWDWPVSRTARFPDAAPETKAPIGYLPDRLSTDSLMTTLNSLCENGRASIIANPKMEVPQEGWFPVIVPSNDHSHMQPELQNVESRTVLTMTPHIGDHNDITLRMTAAVSDSTPATRAGGLPPTRRRTMNESITVKDGDTFAVAGLADDRTEQTDKPSRKVVVFVTARLASNTTAASLPAPLPAKTVVRESPRVTATFTDTDLRDVLSEIAQRTGVKITPDTTVKATPVTTELADASADAALRQVLKNTPYIFRNIGSGDYGVFRPQTLSFTGANLVQALQDLATSAEVPIVVDPNVSGTVSATFENVPLEEALQLMLAGKPVVYKKTARYYIVVDRNITRLSFQEVSETRRIRLNYVRPAQVTQRLSPVFAPYVQAEQPNPRDPNDQGNTLLIMANPALADRIVADIQKIDRLKRQVLLDARVVSMEKGNLLNLGVEWSRLTTRAGASASYGITSSTETTTGGWPYSIQIGYAPDQTFTNSLMTALNLLQENKQADIIANPKVVAQDGRQAEIKVIEEEWFAMTGPATKDGSDTRPELQKIESGTVLAITPFVGDNNDITLQMAVEVSDVIPKAQGSDLPRVTRRLVKNSVTVKDGGTVAVGGLPENRRKMDEKRAAGVSSIPLIGELFKNNGKSSREVAVFVTVHLVPDTDRASLQPAAAVETKVRVQKTSNNAKVEQIPAVDQRTSRAWSILRQWNCPPLLLGLTPQLTKVLEPSRRNDPVWQEVANGGTLRLRLDVEGGLPGEVIVGLFKDAAWLAEPVAVRHLGGAGTHTLKGLPAGRYQIGAMIGGAPVPVALGVQRTWPEPIEIQRDQAVTADVLVSEAFQKWASGWYNEGVAKDYVGQWGDLNETNLLQGQLTGPDGKPIPFGLIEIREHHPGARSTATADQGTNEQGLYKYDGMAWPYQITALWRQAIPSAFGYRRQRMYLSRVLEGPQRMDFRFEPFPEGTARVTGRLIDQNGKPVRGFFLRVHTPPFNDLNLSRLTGGYKTQVTYDVPFISEDGRFELGGLPAGRATVDILPFEVQRYQHERGKDVVLEAGETAQVDVELVGKGVFHGRVLFEDGTPAVLTPAPWRGAVTRILMTFGPRAGSIGAVGPDGYFTLYLEDSDAQTLAQGNSRLVINVPSDQQRRWDKTGEFPYEKLAEDKSKAGIVTVKRPRPAPTPPAEQL